MNTFRANRILENVKNNTLSKIFVSAFDCEKVMKIHRDLAFQTGQASKKGLLEVVQEEC